MYPKHVILHLYPIGHEHVIVDKILAYAYDLGPISHSIGMLLLNSLFHVHVCFSDYNLDPIDHYSVDDVGPGDFLFRVEVFSG